MSRAFLTTHPFSLRIFFILAWLTFTVSQVQSATLGTTALLVGPTAGTNSVVLAATMETDAWTATANDTWLHLDPANQSGIGSTNVIFSIDTNPGGTRTGTLNIADHTLTITQAGSTYTAVESVTMLLYSGLAYPEGLKVDGDGNLYFADNDHHAIKKWIAASNTVTSLVPDGLIFEPNGVALDGAGNIYIADMADGPWGFKKWSMESNTMTQLQLGDVWSIYADVALDAAGNFYIADIGNNRIKKWTETNNSVTTFMSSVSVYGLAVDVAGNVYFSDNSAVKKWTAANNTVTTLVSSGLRGLYGLTVDGAGNIYIADAGNHVVKKWTVATGNMTTLMESNTFHSCFRGVAVDGAGNLYATADCNNKILELPNAFVDPSPRFEGPAAGNDTLPTVLPATANLRNQFAPTSDQPWLIITGITNGVVSFTFTANVVGMSRTAHISLLGQSIPITQAAGLSGPMLTSTTLLGNGVVQFTFSNDIPGSSFTVLSTTNLSLPLTDWAVAGTPTNIVPGLFQFTSQPTTNDPQRFYLLRSL